MLYKKSELETMFVNDIETIAEFDTIDKLSGEKKDVWLRKYHTKHYKQEIEFLQMEEELFGIKSELPSINDIYLKYAALHAEYSKILCVAFGIFDTKNKNALDIDCFANTDEKKVLQDFADILNKLPAYILTGYNISGFDIPFLIKRMIINGIALPKQLQIKGKKPWEITIHDIMNDWKLTGWEPITLDLLCLTLGVQSPKDEIKNFQVSTYFHEGRLTLDQISKYCKKDITAEMKVILKLVA